MRAGACRCVLVAVGLCLSASSVARAEPPEYESCLYTPATAALPRQVRETSPMDPSGAQPRAVELTEVLPRELPADAPFAGWLVIPVSDERELTDYTSRSLDYMLHAVTPMGTFGVSITSLVKATRVGAKEGVHEGAPQQGVLALLCFDPRQKGPLVYPHPSPDARK